MNKSEKIKSLRESTGMNRKEFCEYFQIPYRTVTEWERDNRHAPEYVLRLLEYYIRMEKLNKEDAKMHKIFGTKEDVTYLDRKGAYLIPIKSDCIAVVQTAKGYFLLGGGLDDEEEEIAGIERECLEEIGYKVAVNDKIGSAESYCKSSKIGYFHPIQNYYIGELLEKVQNPVEDDHKLVWVKYEDLKGKMYAEMQNWAIEEGWRRKHR